MVQLQGDTKKSWRLFTINISLIIIVFLSGIILGFVVRTNRIIKDQMVVTARSHFKNIILTRRWNADHGGVYVEKTKGVTSNPYLENPDIKTIDGKTYTKKNPATMTREISEYAKKANDFVYHITSLKPINPNNAPDTFEKKVLKMFNTGSKEFSETKKDGDKTIFRYMAPLYVEKPCLACHARQGYKTGDVRGGISVSFDISKIEKKMSTNKMLIAVGSILTIAFMIFIIFIVISRLANKLTTAYQTISLMAVTDELTQIFNRRHFHSCLDEEIERSRRYGHPMSFLMLDIDYFKQVNDTYGHQTGDDVLVGLADTVKSVTRNSDIIARYGGEEIAVILPETGVDGAFECAENIRHQVEKMEFYTDGADSFRITVSIGVSSTQKTKKIEAKNLIKLADTALYKAKEKGRNQVVIHS